MGNRRFELLISLFSILCLVWFSSGFSPVDNLLIDCGSSTNTTVDGRVFMADDLASDLLSTPEKLLANTSKPVTSSNDSSLYQTARIFTSTSKYTLPIRQSGRHWIRLYFFPFVSGTHNLSLANFAVSTQDHLLLSDFTVRSRVVKEFSVNVTTNTLIITFIPSNNSFAFINALEVVSVPNQLITDDASVIGQAGGFLGLLWQALETVARVNMGGPTITPSNDTLGRTWVPDGNFLVEKNLAKSVSNIGAVNYVDGGSTPDIAPKTVYGTASEMNSADNPINNFNVTWEFSINPGYQYLLRFHFCDIVSLSLNQLYFNVYVDSWLVVRDLDLSTYLVNTLGAAYYMDYVTVPAVSNKLRVSIGPSALHLDFPNAILNGLEIMKMNNSAGSLSGPPINLSASSSKKNVAMIVGVTVGAFFAMVLAGILFLVCRRRKLLAQGHSKTWIPLSINGETSHTMGSKCSNGTIASIASNLGYRYPFAVVQEATNNFDESWVLGIGGFGKVYKGVMNDGMKVAVKRGNPKSHQGLAEFQTEIQMLSHSEPPFGSLIGYCDEKKRDDLDL
ncbi:probable receptor-like protein kinase At5g59700 [Carica papaya]|uniref:probable receptor-like protein kinase At5g59700 n=1 Tax=Carica papaya TaxID=3649 RepID=UPI000B8C7A5A|nr:probable receptor-like protein kinase At5g59700 [Carica papaya]